MEAHVEDVPETSWKASVAFHLLVSFVVNSVVNGVTLLLWSSIFFGHDMFHFLHELSWLSLILLGVCGAIIFTLYMLDFFWPPHLDELCVLWSGDRYVGRGLLGLATIMFIVACYLRTHSFVSLPLLISICVCPLAVLAAHAAYDPFKPPELKRRRTEIVRDGNVEDKIRLLKRITGEELNESMFYKACSITFSMWFAINLTAFIVMTVLRGPSLEELTADMPAEDRDTVYVQWACPLVMSIANLVYGLFAFMRVNVQDAYSRTDRYKNQLIADLSQSSIVKDMTEHKLATLVEARSSTINGVETGEELQGKQQQYLEQHTAMVNQLSTILKGVVCMFILLLGLAYCARQMLYASTHMASMVAGTMCIFFLTFCIFAYVSLYRVVRAMGKWMVELPAWQTFQSMLTNAWVRATLVCSFTPLLPFIVLLSVMNQFVRKRRGIYSVAVLPGVASPDRPDGSEAADEGKLQTVGSGEANPKELLLTPRVSKRMVLLRGFQWLDIVPKVYILCLGAFAYTIVPAPLNVALAAMNNVIDQASIPYPLILAAIFIIGIILFLLPPVPGAVMYMFGGLVSAAHCPPKGTEQGFWTGAVISIFLGLVMKLMACAVQQAGIGGLMGRNLWIRQQAGVHKTVVRCIEHVLRQKGFTAGKVAILCGGPDWPTSVLAGILKLSVLEMEIGTLPIIGFIAPFGLSGSLRLRVGESEMWENSAQLMLVSAGLVNLLLWALAGWACQQALEKNREALTRPLVQNVDLEWLDYRSKCIKERLQVRWEDVPFRVRLLWATGAIVQILVCYGFFFGSSYLVGDFQINHDLSTLKFADWGVTSDDEAGGLFSYLCLVVVGMYTLAWLGDVQYNWWRGNKLKKPAEEAAKEVDAKESEWKDEYVRMCAGPAAPSAAPETPGEVEQEPEPPPAPAEVPEGESQVYADANWRVSEEEQIPRPS